MTLADLAALAATVEGFERPKTDCDCCDEGTITDEFGDYVRECRTCKGTALIFDNSPAALAMAAIVALRRSERFNMLDVASGARLFEQSGDSDVVVADVVDLDTSPEGIARALLTALLRAHGVEVPNG